MFEKSESIPVISTEEYLYKRRVLKEERDYEEPSFMKVEYEKSPAIVLAELYR